MQLEHFPWRKMELQNEGESLSPREGLQKSRCWVE